MTEVSTVNSFSENFDLGGRRLVRDPKFGFLRVEPRPSDEELSAYYSASYRSPCVPHDPGRRAALAIGVCGAPGRVLDIGCGRGEFLAQFVQRGWDAVGIEPNAATADIAEQRGLHVIREMLTVELARSLGRFHCVSLVHVLEHLRQPEAMLELVSDLLIPGGVLFCETPNDFNALQRAAVVSQGLPPWWIVTPDHLNYFCIETLATFIQSFGFDVPIRTTDFPMELFLLWGEHYVGDSALGKDCHERRVRFEHAMRESGQDDVLQAMYSALAQIGLGRNAIICAQKR